MRGTEAGFSRLPTDEVRRVDRRSAGCTRLVALSALALGTLLVGRAAYRRGAEQGAGLGGRQRYPPDCPLSLSVWSRGLMRSCCDVFPKNFTYVKERRGSTSRGEHSTTDWATEPIRNGSIVYVPSLDIPAFLDRFDAFPPSARITLVSGQEDVGMPRELWGLGPRRDLSVGMRVGLEAFLADERLLHWWVQNYDLLGCNPYSGCSHLSAGLTPDLALLTRSKVSPIPIGLDFHTIAEKLPKPSARVPACSQQRELERVRDALPSFRDRPDRLLAPFKCRKDRLDACAALQPPAGIATFFNGPRSQMWAAMGAHAFVAAPRGHGVDTHRLWEILALGSVPVAISSSLDGLYAGYPVITIERWEDANASALGAWRAQIVRKFGSDPLGGPRMRRMLTSAHWSERIGRQHGAVVGGAPLAQQPLLPTARTGGLGARRA